MRAPLRYVGIDLGSETVKLVELRRDGPDAPLRLHDRVSVEHHKDPAGTLLRLLSALDWDGVTAATATGRGSRLLTCERVPTKAAMARGALHRHPDLVPGLVVHIGGHGFSVLELRRGGQHAWKENSRCSQGTGNFLRQLVGRFDLDVEQASRLVENVENPAALSGRCPVILKTDMTHLANKGEDRAAILAGLYDAVCENVQVLIKPRLIEGVAEGAQPKVLLAGGVTQAERVRRNFRRFLAERGLELVEEPPEEALYVDALGAALVAAEHGARPPALDALVRAESDHSFDRVPALHTALDRVRRMPPVAPVHDGTPRDVWLGFDIGSTGSKAVALEAGTRAVVWEGYTNTLGNPVAAARQLARRFVDETGGVHRVRAVGATGSGREIVGSLMKACYGPDPVFVLNEIAAHAEGALHFDPEVDTIFEIGGQDAKYIRLDAGRIVDAAMNEACSAGTGSFIEEQGRKFGEVRDVVHMGQLAVTAGEGISLGQHCSVFMAEVIDEAVAAGVGRDPILAGIYDSIIQNYLNRVKGNRTVGRRIFCQGMPFASDALAAAVARQTGRSVVVPPNPGTIGALGIALLAGREAAVGEPLDLGRFLTAEVDRKDTFLCKSTRGCGEPGNRCRIDRIHATVADRKLKFVWGGNCSLYDRGTRSRKLPDRAPDPFKERRDLVAAIIDRVQAEDPARADAPLVAMTDEFTLKGLLPFFATFVHALGFRLRVHTGAGPRTLKRGIDEAHVPFCAPMQLYQGVMAELLDEKPDVLLVPRLRELPRQRGETNAPTCPIVQASPDIVRRMAPAGHPTRILTPRIDIGTGNDRSARWIASIRRLAEELGAGDRWEPAYEAARAEQRRFDAALRAIGRRALDFARAHDLPAIVVLGRPYTITNDVLNSNVPNILRSQGAIGIPVDCYPVSDDVPVFDDLFWGYAQANLRAAWQVRRTDGVWPIYCSNYSCGPDSFNLHFFSYTMENKPFAIIETDGHSGDAGTRTRVEAFLFCVDGDRRLSPEQRAALPVNDFKRIEEAKQSLDGVRENGELLLIPRMGPGAEVVAEVLASEGIAAEALPTPDREALALGRRHTSGKECVPMTITLGSLLQRLERERDTDRKLSFFMPTAPGPCRFGVYNMLHKIVAERTGWKDRLSVVSPSSSDYFAGTSPDFRVRALVGFTAADLLLAALHDVRPVERVPGAAEATWRRGMAELKARMRAIPSGSLVDGLAELAGGMFGIRDMLQRYGDEFARLKDPDRHLPTVSVVGEIYVRLDPFANGHVVRELEKRGLKALMAPFHEWIEYTSALKLQRKREGRGYPGDLKPSTAVSTALERAAIDRLYHDMATRLGWHPRTTVADSLAAADPYISRELYGEAVLTLGGPVHEHEQGFIDGVVAVGPHECMPTKVAEAQFAHVGAEKGLISLVLPLNGDPVDPEILDRFAFEVKERYAARKRDPAGHPAVATRAVREMLLLNSLRLLRPFARPRVPGQPAAAPPAK